MSELILYDLPSKEPRVCWSYNPWKSDFSISIIVCLLWHFQLDWSSITRSWIIKQSGLNIQTSNQLWKISKSTYAGEVLWFMIQCSTKPTRRDPLYYTHGTIPWWDICHGLQEDCYSNWKRTSRTISAFGFSRSRKFNENRKQYHDATQGSCCAWRLHECAARRIEEIFQQNERSEFR